MQLLDTHQHLLYRDEFNYAWSDELPAIAKKNFTVEDYQDVTKDYNVAASIFMEVDADDYQKETRFIAELAVDQANRIIGLISSCRPEIDAGFDAWLEECGELPIVGFRRILHEVSDAMSKNENFRKNVRKIGKCGQVFDMVFRADQLGIAKEFAQSCDDMHLVLDHCGVPDIAGGKMDDWRNAISALAELPHVSCKISGILTYCKSGEANLESIRPYVDHVIEVFGSQRLVWGSDWPVVNLNSGLPQWVDIFCELVNGLSTDEADAVGSGNAQRIYNVSM